MVEAGIGGQGGTPNDRNYELPLLLDPIQHMGFGDEDRDRVVWVAKATRQADAYSSSGQCGVCHAAAWNETANRSQINYVDVAV